MLSEWINEPTPLPEAGYAAPCRCRCHPVQSVRLSGRLQSTGHGKDELIVQTPSLTIKIVINKDLKPMCFVGI
jgi:hypothetical protein